MPPEVALAIGDGLLPLYFGEPQAMPSTNQPDAAGPTENSIPVRSIAYLGSRYPTLSMIFVLREVLALRALGFRIETASINPPDRPPEKLTPQEREPEGRARAELAEVWAWLQRTGLAATGSYDTDANPPHGQGAASPGDNKIKDAAGETAGKDEAIA